MAFRKFSTALGVQLALVLGTFTGIAYLLVSTHLIVVIVLLVLVAAGQIWHIYRSVSHMNAELARFVAAVRYTDYSQNFRTVPAGAGFEELARAMNASMLRLKESRHLLEGQTQKLRALVEHVPVPLICVDQDRRVTLLNGAARKMFNTAAVKEVDDLKKFGISLYDTVLTLPPGRHVMVGFEGEEGEIKVAVSATQFTSGTSHLRLISLNNIHNELETTELEAWQQIVRVLTHEIMNSATPISSLAKTARDLLSDMTADGTPAAELLDDLAQAVEAVARRSDGLVQFVEGYRQLARVPCPKPQRLPLKSVFRRLERLVVPDVQNEGINLILELASESLEVNADPGQLDQILLNLLRNARDAVRGREGATIWLIGRLSRAGRPIIEVADNGAGVPPEIEGSVFLPFFTTKHNGSGIGLPLSRQIMRAHNGSLQFRRREGGGARFLLYF